LVRAAVQVSALLTQGVLANRLNEDTFVAVLARHSRAKQRLLFREIFRVIRRYRTLLTISNSIATEVHVDKAIQKVCIPLCVFSTVLSLIFEYFSLHFRL
jgi:hypothetical protein